MKKIISAFAAAAVAGGLAVAAPVALAPTAQAGIVLPGDVTGHKGCYYKYINVGGSISRYKVCR